MVDQISALVMTLESKTLNSLKSFVEIALKLSSSTTVSD